MNDYEIKTMYNQVQKIEAGLKIATNEVPKWFYDQVQKLEEELKMLKQEKGNCDCCKKED